MNIVILSCSMHIEATVAKEGHLYILRICLSCKGDVNLLFMRCSVSGVRYLWHIRSNLSTLSAEWTTEDHKTTE